MRNRRHVQRGPLVVLTEEAIKQGAGKAFRNLSGVEVASVERLNLLQLAPGGHLGRFCVWSKAAFERLDAIYGTHRAKSEEKNGYQPPRAMMSNAGLPRQELHQVPPHQEEPPQEPRCDDQAQPIRQV